MDDCGLAGNGQKCHGFFIFFTVRIKIFASSTFI